MAPPIFCYSTFFQTLFCTRQETSQYSLRKYFIVLRLPNFYSKHQRRCIWNLQGPSHLGYCPVLSQIIAVDGRMYCKKSNNGEYKYPSYAQTNFHFLEFLMYTHMSWYVIYLHSLPLIDKGRYAFWMWNGDIARLMKQPGQCPAMRKTKSGTASTPKNRICSGQLLIRSRNIAKNVILAIINFFVLLYPPACFSNLISE